MKYNNINLIYSITENNVMGINGKLPFMLPEDLKMFKELTTGNAVIMGRKTFDSLPESVKPLPNRLNLVLTSKYNKSVIDTEEFLNKNNIFRDLKTLKDIDDTLKESIDEPNILKLASVFLKKISSVYGLEHFNNSITDVHEFRKFIEETLTKKLNLIDDRHLITEEKVFNRELFFNNVDSLLDIFIYSFLMGFIKKDNFEIFVIGGKKVLEDFADKADNIYLTRVYTITPLENKRNITYGPDIDLCEKFELTESSGIRLSSSGLKYEFLKYSRKEEYPEPYLGD